MSVVVEKSDVEKSDAEKTEKQLNYLVNNNLMNVYDTNLFIKSYKKYKQANIDAGMPDEEATKNAEKLASKESYRNFRLENVMGFLCSGEFYDMRQQNKIAERFGEEIASQLTKAMVNKMQSDETMINEELDEPKILGQQGKEESLGRKRQKLETLMAEKAKIEKEIKALKKEIDIYDREISPDQTSLF